MNAGSLQPKYRPLTPTIEVNDNSEDTIEPDKAFELKETVIESSRK